MWVLFILFCLFVFDSIVSSKDKMIARDLIKQACDYLPLDVTSSAQTPHLEPSFYFVIFHLMPTAITILNLESSCIFQQHNGKAKALTPGVIYLRVGLLCSEEF